MCRVAASPTRSLWRFLGRALATWTDFGEAGMVRLAPLARLGARLELHRLDVRTSDDEVAFDEPHGQRGHILALVIPVNEHDLRYITGSGHAPGVAESSVALPPVQGAPAPILQSAPLTRRMRRHPSPPQMHVSSRLQRFDMQPIPASPPRHAPPSRYGRCRVDLTLRTSELPMPLARGAIFVNPVGEVGFGSHGEPIGSPL
jgi:hypothetical protein